MPATLARLDKRSESFYIYSMDPVCKSPNQNEKTIAIGDIIPIQGCEMLDVFYLVKVGDSRFLINKKGVVFLKNRIEGAAETGSETENRLMTSLISNGKGGDAEVVELICQPGSEAYLQAERTVKAFIVFFLNHLRNEFRIVCIKFTRMIEGSGRPLLKYLAKENGGLNGLKAHLIREFFTHTNIEERSLNVLAFLTQVISLQEDGTLAEQNHLTPEQLKEILIDFLNHVRGLGTNTSRKEIFEKTYLNFIDREYELLLKEGGAGFYIKSSFQKTLKAQKDLLANDSNRNYIDAAYRNALRIQQDFMLAHMRSYLKAAVILRLQSNSKKEQRGRNDDEREKILRDIIAYQKEF
jgi:hypothetical protein